MKAFDVQYFKGDGRELSHVYSEIWKKTDYFCPGCGKREVWHAAGGGDYYVGEQHICIACAHEFYLPNGVNTCSGEQDAQRLAALKSPH